MYLAEKYIWALIGVVFCVSPVMAAWEPSAADMAALPPYCAAKFGERANPELARTWRSSMGDDFIHIHHYCAGLNFLNRSRSMPSSKTRDVLGAVVREFDYVLTHASPDFYLRSEILMNRGIALSRAKRKGEAVGNLLKAIELDPKQSRAYMALADLYADQNNRSKALETATEGLRHNPDTKSLQRRYRELGGKMPYPDAIEPAVNAQAEPDQPSAATTTSAAQVDSVPSAVSTPEEPFVAPPPIGTPKNPYCRFCP
ncbi:MAG TPA: hypothetical protein VIN38_13995 [Thiobacillus sp.]